jgi:hypothetical protein
MWKREEVQAVLFALRQYRSHLALDMDAVAVGLGARNEQYLVSGWAFDNKRPCLVR